MAYGESNGHDSRGRWRHVTQPGHTRDPNSFRAQYLENSYRCYLATIAIFEINCYLANFLHAVLMISLWQNERYHRLLPWLLTVSTLTYTFTPRVHDIHSLHNAIYFLSVKTYLHDLTILGIFKAFQQWRSIGLLRFSVPWEFLFIYGLFCGTILGFLEMDSGCILCL